VKKQKEKGKEFPPDWEGKEGEYSIFFQSKGTRLQEEKKKKGAAEL